MVLSGIHYSVWYSWVASVPVFCNSWVELSGIHSSVLIQLSGIHSSVWYSWVASMWLVNTLSSLPHLLGTSARKFVWGTSLTRGGRTCFGVILVNIELCGATLNHCTDAETERVVWRGRSASDISSKTWTCHSQRREVKLKCVVYVWKLCGTNSRRQRSALVFYRTVHMSTASTASASGAVPNSLKTL